MNHTAGILNVDDDPNFGTMLFNDPYGLNRENILSFIYNKKALNKPGETYYYYYSTGYELLTLIIDNITGDHVNFYRESLFIPNNLSNTFYKEPYSTLSERLPNNYFERYGNGKIENISKINFHLQNELTGSDGIIATVADYGLFLEKLLNHEIVSPASLSEMKNFIPTDNSQTEGYGLGLRIRNSNYGVYIGHGGRSIEAGMDLFYFEETNTTILGAVKFSGKTKKGLSVGLMESVTAAEYTEINNNGNTKNQLIEPLTNYFVGRVQQDFNNKNMFIGGIVTSTIRAIDDNVDFLHQSAFSAGLDVHHQWKNRSWYAGANLVMSQVTGSKEVILNTQTAITHLFQREDANYVKVDPNKTSLTGTGGDLKFGKAGSGHVKFETGVTWRSPELELNDIGFMCQADEIQNYAGITYSLLKPFGLFRKAAIEYKH